ncbi:MAG: nicotinate-nucleotide--dimethylbenzimidazole phosphoribosyltransferase [Patulibacter sp.]|nr:nicotinate-nucleotide--dimethylbenzimidazole phosphoribosyltransferase [Patulibacter sp.]
MHDGPEEYVRPATPAGFDPSRAADRASDPEGWRFPDADRDALHAIIAGRRDIRRFRPDPVPQEILDRVLAAAHRGPSVGLMQPWRFVVIRDDATRGAMRTLAQGERLRQAERFPGRARHFLDQKIEGIVDAPLAIVVCCDPGEPGVEVLGRGTIPETDVHSTACAIQNLWLAARAEGLGVGWVSFYRRQDLRNLLGIPHRVDPMAWLCVGWPDERPVRPGLEAAGWAQRAPLSAVTLDERWPAEDVPSVGGAILVDGGEDRGAPETHALNEPPSSASDATLPATPGAPAETPTRGGAADPAAEPLPAVLRALTDGIGAPDPRAATAVRDRADRLIKPLGSLGALEQVVERWAAWTGDAPPSPLRPAILVLAADHGHVTRGTSLYGSGVTAQVAAAAARGGSAIAVLARHHAGLVTVADVGLAGERTPPGVRPARIRDGGTRDITQEPGLTPDETLAAITVGAELAGALLERGARCLVPGEIGIGNTTAAAALGCALAGLTPEQAVGRGAGADAAGLERKREAVRTALARSGSPRDPLRALGELGGLELAGLVGAILAAARRRAPVILDGFAVGVAALAAVQICPAARDGLIAGHRSAEPAHGAILALLGLEPLLDLRIRLGEGTGAALALPLIDQAGRLHREMETFVEAGLDGPRRTPPTA